MKTFIFFAILILGFFAAITAAVRPDILEEKYNEIRAPIDQHFEAEAKQEQRQNKEQARAAWMLKLQLPKECSSTTSALKEIECKNQKDQHMQQFERSWRSNH